MCCFGCTVFFTDGALWGGRAGAAVFSDILNVRESYALGSHATVFQSEVYAILECSEYCIPSSTCSDSRVALLALKSYAVSSRIVLQCGDSLHELALSNSCGSLDTVVFMEIRRPTHLQERYQVLLLWGQSLVFRWHLRVRRRERECLLKSHCASWSLETACRQSRIW
jgi:hypothetical protein